MPVRAPSLRACGCVVASGFRCEHMVAADQERKARFDKTRPSASKRGYDRRWEAERKGYLKSHPFCAKCKEQGLKVLATVVDHKVPHRGDKVLFWSKSNWQGLCAHHHNSAKQSEERR